VDLKPKRARKELKVKYVVFFVAAIVIFVTISAFIPESHAVTITQDNMFVYPAESGTGFTLVYGPRRYYQAEAAPAGCYLLTEPGPLSSSEVGTAKYLGETCP
jgi:hypothetical protein